MAAPVAAAPRIDSTYAQVTAPLRAADASSCDDPRVTIVGPLPEPFRAAVVRACADLAGVSDADPNARIRLTVVRGRLRIDVVLADGRATTRSVRAPEDVSATLEALVALPPSDGRASRVPPAPGVAGDTPSSSGAPTPPSALAPAAPAEHAPSTTGATAPAVTISNPAAAAAIGVDIFAGIGGRYAGGGYGSATFAASAALHIGDWLVGTDVRWEPLQSKSTPGLSDFEMQTIATGLDFARRSAVGFGDIDLGISPRLVLETQSYQGTSDEPASTAADIRLAAIARLFWGRGATRPSLEIDGELSPARVRRSVRLDANLPLLPAWSAGALVGLAWGS